MTKKKAIGIMLVDDHQMLRDGLRILIESEQGLHIVAEATSGEEALEILAAQAQDVDVAVMDLGLPDMGGLEVIEEIREQGLDCRVVVLTMHNDRAIISRAIKVGIDGFVPKSAAHTNLLEAIRAVDGGAQYLHPQSMAAIFPELAQSPARVSPLDRLSERESEVLKLIAMGHTSREIGELLSLSPKTVDTYRLRSMKKLDLNNRVELIQFALETGLLDGT